MFCLKSPKTKNNKPVGLFGGTFNPIHIGHIEIARQAYRELDLQKVIVMPSGRPPHKRNMEIEDDDARCAMVKLAIEDYPELEFSDYEILKEGYSFSSDTLTEFVKLYQDICFIIGADSLFQIENWHCPEIVMELAVIAVANRDNHAAEELYAQARHLSEKYRARIKFLHMRDMPVSSSEIRERIKNGKLVTGMLSPKVENFIYRNGLYGN